MSPSTNGPRNHLAKSPFNEARKVVPADPIPVGSMLSHDRHGVGKVVALDGETSIIVDFGQGVRMRVNLNSPRIERL